MKTELKIAEENIEKRFYWFILGLLSLMTSIYLDYSGYNGIHFYLTGFFGFGLIAFWIKKTKGENPK